MSFGKPKAKTEEHTIVRLVITNVVSEHHSLLPRFILWLYLPTSSLIRSISQIIYECIPSIGPKETLTNLIDNKCEDDSTFIKETNAKIVNII